MRKQFMKLGGVLHAIALVAVAATGSSAFGKSSRAQVLRVAIGAEPPSLDPGLATDTTSSNVLLNIDTPIVRLGRPPALRPLPAGASSWAVHGATVILHLNKKVRWSNGKPVTASDYVFSWLRTISPELGADYAYQFFGIRGAEAYNSCDPTKTNCNALKAKVGIKASGRYTLVVHLIAPQSWFIQQLSHNSFLPVYRPALAKWGNHFTEAGHDVTDGPFNLTTWQHDAQIVLTKNKRYYNAKAVRLSKIVMPIITDGSTAENAFNAGNVDVDNNCCPVADIPKLKQTPYWRLFQALGTYYYGVNVKNVPNVNQRHAMGLAINRRDIIDRIAQGNQVPARGFTPQGISGGPTILANSHLPATPNFTEAKALMAKVSNPVRNIHLYINNSPGHINIAVAVQSYWKQLGLDVTIKTMEWKQYLQFLGPPPNSDVDVYRLGWIADYPDAYNFLSLWECNSGNNNTNFCNSTFDKTVEKAGRTQSVQARLKLYQAAETILTGNNGQFPILPIYWYTFHDLVKTYVHGWFANPMDQYDFSKVSLS